MSGEVPFHLTGMGRQFFERTMPDLVRELSRLNDNLEKLASGTEGESVAKTEEKLPNVPR